MTVIQEVQKLAPDAIVELYKLDFTNLGGSIMYFHGDTVQGPIWFDGVQYDPWPIKTEGFARTSDKQPTPKMSIANLDSAVSALCNQYSDLVGAKLTRIRTFGKFIDARNFGKKNLLTNTEAFQIPPSAPWVKANISVSSNLINGPDGTLTADKIAATTTTGNHYIEQTYSSFADNEKVSTSIYMQKLNYSYGRLQFFAKNGSGPTLTFNFDTAVMTNSQGTGQSGITFEVESVGSGWYRFKINGADTLTGATVPRIRVYMLDNAQNATWTGDGTSGTYIWGAQMERGVYVTTYEAKDAFGRNPSANPAEQFKPEVWFVERKSGESNKVVEFELSSAFDLSGMQLPRRTIIANYCSWKTMGGYRGANCGYTGPPVAKEDGTATTDPLLDKCGGKLSDCKLRQWPGGVLNYGGFPAAGLVRM
jgi:lambda family phage minor tail protein L